MDKMKFKTSDLVSENIEKIGALFPSVLTEIRGENGQIQKGINFEMLKQLLSREIVEGGERYEFTWVGKKAARIEAAQPITKTLRPDRYGSRDWDHTQNLYIEGDNLEVLKLLRESYSEAVQVIYIDPPYNTGRDCIYPDKYQRAQREENEQMGALDESGNQLFVNTERNGRFHSAWCSMIYSRLLLAKNLLAPGGVIFISIDDNEESNLTKICDEVFGRENRLGPVIQNKRNAKNDTANVQRNHEYVLIYQKGYHSDLSSIPPALSRKKEVCRSVYEEGGRYYYLNDPITTRGDGGTLNARPNLGYTIYYHPETQDKNAVDDYDHALARTSNDEEAVYRTDASLLAQGYVAIRPPKVRGKLGCWTWELERFNRQKDDIVITGKAGSYTVRRRTFIDAGDVQMQDGKAVYIAVTDANSNSILDFSTSEGTAALNALFEQTGLFQNPKNLDMLQYFIGLVGKKDITVLDFFSGSATTAHAVMQLNAQDGGGRRFIMVQTDKVEPGYEKTEAWKAGYRNICEIGKERIRRAGDSLKAEFPSLDVGFRVFRVDESNMEDIYYHPESITQQMLDGMVSNIKPDRTDLDLLYACLLDWGIGLHLPHAVDHVDGCTIHDVGHGALVACFDSAIPHSVIHAMAARHTRCATFRDSAFSSDPDKINVTEIFKSLSPGTKIKVI